MLARSLGMLTIGALCAGAAAAGTLATPIQDVVVIFQENVSFDHYFASYPRAANPAGEPQFFALPGTPTVNGLTGALLTNNSNKNNATNVPQINPFLLDRSQASTCDQDHDYGDEQLAFDGGNGSVPSQRRRG